MKYKLLSIIVFAGLSLAVAGCNQNTPSTARDVAEARADANKEVIEARQDASETMSKSNEEVASAREDYLRIDEGAREDLTEAESDAMVASAKAEFNIARTEAEGRYNIATEKCGAYTGVDRTACLSGADATYASAKALAIADRDEALVRADHHE